MQIAANINAFECLYFLLVWANFNPLKITLRLIFKHSERVVFLPQYSGGGNLFIRHEIAKDHKREPILLICLALSSLASS